MKTKVIWLIVVLALILYFIYDLFAYGNFNNTIVNISFVIIFLVGSYVIVKNRHRL